MQEGPSEYVAFFPKALPPEPPLDLDIDLIRLLDQANQALGRLDGITLLLPEPTQFLYAFVRKEAVLSSQIEGTMSSLSDLLLFENGVATAAPVEDVEEAVNYIAALNHGIDSIESGQLPLCSRLMREIHARLLRSGRGSDKTPGEFRRSQNWLGGTRPGNTRYVPPPWEEVEPAMSALERFLHDDPAPSPVLIKAVEVAASTADTTRGIVEMIERDRRRIHGLGRAAPAHRVHDIAVNRVVVKATTAARQLNLTEPPVYGAIARLEELGILREVTGRARGKTYVYGEYMDILNEGTEL